MHARTKDMRLVAVFGHYDSRGGAFGIALPDNATVEDVKQACVQYDRDICCWDLTADRARYDADGGVGWGWDPHNPATYSDPHEEDFLYVALLHNPREIDIIGPDLEYGYGDQTTAILIEPSGGSAPYVEGKYPMVDPGGGKLGLDDLITASLANPVKLEVIVSPDGGDLDPDDEDDDVRLERWRSYAVYLTNGDEANLGEDACGFSLVELGRA